MNITGKRILIAPSDIATKRTKERIKQHGENGIAPFKVEDWRGISDQNMSFLLRADDGWFGWLHKDQFVHLATLINDRN
jgi:hypothetical protein